MSTITPMDFYTSSAERPSYIEELRAESRGLPYRPAKRKKSNERLPPNPRDSHRLFTIEKGNRWMELARREPEAKMLMGELWHQGELCMLFADTNIGKSVLAVQIGESIARGQNIGPFPCQAPPARVLYIDFELTQAQFGQRYSQGDEDHQFSDNFYRAQYNFIPDPPPNVDENELLIAAIEYKIQLAKATVLIIDNITCLRGGTENSAVALALMKSLKALKTDHNLSILVLAHTPKRRNPTQPISADDLHGSKLLVNFADSAFAIGKSTLRGPQCALREPQYDTNSGLCYLKQIKQRNTAQRYGADNVCLCRIQKPGAFLHFTFEGHSAEYHHLLSQTAAGRRQLANKIATLAATGLSQRDISKQLGIGLATVNRLLSYADREGFENLKMRKFENEEESTNDPMTNDSMTNDLMTNDLMTNDQKGFEDLTMSKFEDGKECANEERFTNKEGPALSSLPREGREGLSNYAPPPQMHKCADFGECAAMPIPENTNTEGFSNYASPPARPIYNVQNPIGGVTTSIIDIALSPELLDHLKQTKTYENPALGAVRSSRNDEAPPSAEKLRKKS